MDRRRLASWLAFVALGAVVNAQGGRPPINIMGVEPLEFGEPVVGAPFSAEAVTETTQELRDGNRIERRTTTTIARDSVGRVRREQALPPLGPIAVDPEVRIITISDPRRRMTFLIDPARRTVTRSSAPAGAPPPRASDGSRPPGPRPGGPRPGGPGPGGPGPGGPGPGGPRPGAGLPPPNRVSESLGSRQVAGVLAEGTRQTMTIPAGAFGNIRSIDVVTERWYSSELKIVVASRRIDPLGGDVVYRVTNLVRAEPDPSLFEIPADFTVVDRPPPPGRPFDRPTR